MAFVKGSQITDAVSVVNKCLGRMEHGKIGSSLNWMLKKLLSICYMCARENGTHNPTKLKPAKPWDWRKAYGCYNCGSCTPKNLLVQVCKELVIRSSGHFFRI
nr:uncharacterized protein LOC104112394 isoform X2 [Nicotiana tomentosiformis]